ncbi:hypothetical protein [Bradyrhizobium diazoefficiens]|uniref:hypothetical protein n=1 Tax=Bradyrhizobium diazoefficiens TaxID=1355477 RepID=UPI0034741A7B
MATHRDDNEGQKTDQRDQSMIDRLRASKRNAEAADTARGEQAGRIWAQRNAEYQWLKKLADETFHYSQPFETLRAAIDPNEEIDMDEVHEMCFGQIATSNEYIAGFINGAAQAFSEVRHEID